MNQHFLNRYNSLIQFYLDNPVCDSEYFELHHIVPSCLGGSNLGDNLVKLPFRAHALAHWMLSKAYPKNRALRFSFHLTCFGNSHIETGRRPSLRTIQAAKVAHKSALADFYSDPHCLEFHKQKTTEAMHKISTIASVLCAKSKMQIKQTLEKDYIDHFDLAIVEIHLARINHYKKLANKERNRKDRKPIEPLGSQPSEIYDKFIEIHGRDFEVFI